MNRVAIYLRVSSSKQELEGTSLDTQDVGCRRLAKSLGLDITHVITETMSGKDIYTREGISQLRELVRGREISHVIVYALDRLSRKQGQVFLLAEEMEHHGVQLLSVTEEIDNTPVGVMIRQIRAFAAELEREKLIERTGRGRRARVELEGLLLPGRRPPYGYEWQDRLESNGRITPKAKLVINPTTGPIAQRILHDLAKGSSAVEIARRLTSERIPTPSGKEHWYPAVICQLARNTIYYGEPRAMRYAATDDGRVSNPKWGAGVELKSDLVEPLVPYEVWHTAHTTLVKNKKTSARNAKFPEAALLRGGFVRCGYCGSVATAMNAPEKARKWEKEHWIVYGCNPSQRRTHGCPSWSFYAPNLDGIVWDHVVNLLSHPDRVTEELEKRRTADPTERDRSMYQAQLDDLTKRQGRLKQRLAQIDDEDIVASIIADINQMGEQKKFITEELRRLQDVHSAWASNQVDIVQVQEWCRRMRDVAALGQTWEQKRTILSALDMRVRVYNRHHSPRYEIECSIPPLGDIENGSSGSTIINSPLRLVWFRWTDEDERPAA